ncbi:hypothetical protein BOTBODRAFT_110675 [Botryobasidium botryosum FD-172 SS1]|uniref:FAD/NAD(P)-binding domain-containing protein n=1 Tax=Botryobasidium botryosum (strain FD-172 SS1) TaxID=930990 RepID=A0A067MEQ8_BOTB1|nr:hypothetical protein BOTBODRAFT_110675 [Botryobasidium botryosum FD-172 SS1]
MAPKKNIVIVGGAGGAGLARALSPSLDASKHTLTLINDRAFYIHYPAMLRVNVTSDGHLEDRAWVPLDKIFAPGKVGKVKIGTVTKVVDGAVELESGETVPYDFLVLATGSKWEGFLDYPIDRSEAVKLVNSWRQKFANAGEVVIVGGGSVGIETAGEIADFYPSTTVHIVHAQPLLLNDTYPAKVRKAIASQLESKGVKLHLGDLVTEIPATESGTVVTKKGVRLSADLFIPARGPRPNTAYLKSFDPTILAESGGVKVHPTLQVPLANGKTNVFALGDIIEWNEQKMLFKTAAHTAVILPNLLSALNGGKPTKEYKTGAEPIIVTIGRKGGYGYLPFLWGISLGSWVSSTMKSKGLFIDKTRESFGY